MDVLVWNAVRRLAALVSLGLVVAGPPIMRDTLTRAASPFALICVVVSALLAAFAITAAARARRYFVEPPPQALVAAPYRHNARAPLPDAPDVGRQQATRRAASALVAFVMAGSLVVVALASR